jgi:hypothetical protein
MEEVGVLQLSGLLTGNVKESQNDTTGPHKVWGELRSDAI